MVLRWLEYCKFTHAASMESSMRRILMTLTKPPLSDLPINFGNDGYRALWRQGCGGRVAKAGQQSQSIKAHHHSRALPIPKWPTKRGLPPI